MDKQDFTKEITNSHQSESWFPLNENIEAGQSEAGPVLRCRLCGASWSVDFNYIEGNNDKLQDTDTLYNWRNNNRWWLCPAGCYK